MGFEVGFEFFLFLFFFVLGVEGLGFGVWGFRFSSARALPTLARCLSFTREQSEWLSAILEAARKGGSTAGRTEMRVNPSTAAK